MKNKVCIVGHFGIGHDLCNGQTVKTKNIYNELCKIYGKDEISIIDTYGWKKNPVLLFTKCIKGIKNSYNIIVLPAQKGVKVFIPLFSILNNIYKRKIHYIVIGSWLYNLVNNDKNLIFYLKKYNKIYVETNKLKNDLSKLNITNVCIMPNFKDIKAIKEDNIKINKSKNISFCIFSRIMKEKGVEDGIECIKHLTKKYKDYNFKLDIYGPIDKNYVDDFNCIIKELPNNIKYCGVVESSMSVDTVKEYDFLLFPTHFKTEGIPGTILDAYASGVIVIASKWDNFNDIIDDNKTGIGFEINNNKDFFSKVENIIFDYKKINEMKNNSLKKYDLFKAKNAINILVEQLDKDDI